MVETKTQYLLDSNSDEQSNYLRASPKDSDWRPCKQLAPRPISLMTSPVQQLQKASRTDNCARQCSVCVPTVNTKINAVSQCIKSVRQRIRKRRPCVTVSRITKPTVSTNVKTCMQNAVKQKISDKDCGGSLNSTNPIASNSLTEKTFAAKSKPFNRYHVFSYDELRRLDGVLQTQLAISPRPLDCDCYSEHSPEIYLRSCKHCSGTRLSWPSDAVKDCSMNSISQVANLPCFCKFSSSNSRLVNRNVVPNTCPTIADYLPILRVSLLKLICAIRDKLRDEQVVLREIRLNGGAAGCVIDSTGEKYSDLDLIFHIDLSNPTTFVKVKTIVFSVIAHFLAEAFASSSMPCGCCPPICCHSHVTEPCIPVSLKQNSAKFTQKLNTNTVVPTDQRQTSSTAKDAETMNCSPCSVTSTQNANTDLESDTSPNADFAQWHSPCCFTWRNALEDENALVKFYVQKMLRIHKPSLKTADSWSLFTLGYRTSSGSKTVDIKFVDRMQRQFEFTVDSFQIVLDSLLKFYETSRHSMNEHFYPTVVAESVSGSFNEALSHLQERLIVTAKPEEIRGGGLLKYCKLLVDGYRPSKGTDVSSMERYMCSRFFIDFPDIVSQQHRLKYYLSNHFEDDNDLKAAYLQILHEVVSHSTICLMSHERQQTLCLIRMFLQGVLSKEGEQEHSVVHLETFCSDGWTLDSIFYGTSYFPKPFLLVTSSETTSGTIADNTCSTVKQPNFQTADALSSSANGVRVTNNGDQCSSYTNNTDEEHTEVKNGCYMDVVKSPDRKSTASSKNITLLGKNLGRSNWIPIRQKLSDVEEEDVLPRREVAVDGNHCNNTTMISEQAGRLSKDAEQPNVFKSTAHTVPLMIASVGAAKPTDISDKVDINTESAANILSGPPLNYPNTIYCLPQVITYISAPDYSATTTTVCETRTSSETNEVCKTSRSPNCSTDFDIYNRTPNTTTEVSSCHTGILSPSINRNINADINHYIGVPYPDALYSYASYLPASVNNVTPDSSHSIDVPKLPLYYFEHDPNYYAYPHHVTQPSPGVLLAFPM